PLSFVATTPPMVARSADGGSSGIHWWCIASTRFTSPSVAPAWIVAVKSPWRCATTALSLAVEIRTSTCRGAGPQPSLVPEPRTSTHSFARDAHSSTAPSASPDEGWTTTRGTTPSTASDGDPRRTESLPSRETTVSVIDASAIRPFDRVELRVAVLVRNDLVTRPRVVLEAVRHFGFLVLQSVR